MIFAGRLDIHSVIHFIGCYALVPTFMAFGALLGEAVLWAALAGFLWEVTDAMNNELNWKVQFLDPRGADIVDVLVDFAGVGLAWLIF